MGRASTHGRPPEGPPPGIDTSIPAVVLKLDPNVMHHGGLGVIRSLGRWGVPVFGVHEHPLAPAARSRYLHGRYHWRPPGEDPAGVLAGLQRIAAGIGRRAVLIPTDDAGAILLAEHGNVLRRWFAFPAQPRDLPRRLAGKYSMFRLCREAGVPCPEASLPGSWTEAEEFTERAGLPLVAKLSTPWIKGSAGLRSTTLVHSRAELRELYRACEHDQGLMLQEFIPGGRGSDWFFHGYCDAVSDCRPACTGVKERSYPAHAGLTSFGRSVANERLRREATDLLARLSFRGIVDLDYRWDARDGRYKLLDFNPRLGAQFRLFTDPAGIDVARAAYLDLTGQEFTPGAPRTGRGFVVENYDPIAALGYWRSGELGAASWVSSLRGAPETAWFARDDLAPFGLMCAWMGWRALTRRFGRDERPPGLAEPRFRTGRAAARGSGGPQLRETSTCRDNDARKRTGFDSSPP